MSENGSSKITSAANGVLVTMCSCVNVIGTTLPPGYTLTGVNYRDHMLDGAPDGSIDLAIPSGLNSP